LTYIEAAASIAMAERLDRLSADGVRDAKAILDRLWLQIQVIELGQDLMALAADMALKHGLRGYDATHCAAAVAIKDVELVAASGDQRLLEAWRAEGLAVRDTHQR
ncbi:MAG TPA: type II toxin-antitoxin system VapC family toxin, partial [Phycicoccus sp.]|nr:type II toxin-antitoxin system VapC family toxin [Phycicoccus sp.]